MPDLVTHLDQHDQSYHAAPRHELLPLFPRDIRTVMDVGCGDGLLGGALKARGLEVWGIELDEAAAARARGRLDRVICGNIEQADVPEARGRFDCLVYADVLEHTRDPWSILAAQREWLAPRGYVVASIPNIRYYRTLRELAFRGRWRYEESGILDKTHLRFFTLESIQELFAGAGFSIRTVERNIVASRNKRWLNRLCGGRLQERLTFQYFVLAQRT